jgi:multiple sugar transport system substrate-binding protein
LFPIRLAGECGDQLHYSERNTVRISTKMPVTGVIVAALALTGCSSDSGGSGDSVETITLWDAFTQYDAASPYGQLISTCEASTEIRIERTADPSFETKLFQAAASKTTPDLVVLDNPSVAKFADTGLLVSNTNSGLDASAVLPNVLSAGEFEGDTYGAPIGANTLALFYNKALFKAAGLQPPATWDELTAAARSLSTSDVKGIGFSAFASEEGTFQFLPFFWGAGADLDDVASTDAVAALELWKRWVEDGSASSANVNANQQDIRDQFLAGKLGMMVNGTWQLSALDEAGIDYGVVPIPAKNGGAAPSPLGGEFVQVVVSDAATQSAAARFAQCMIDPANLEAWTKGQSYIMPFAEAASAQAEANPALKPWVEAVTAARGRTTELGTAYPTTSTALSTALQEALTGTKSPQAALEDAAAGLKK